MLIALHFYRPRRAPAQFVVGLSLAVVLFAGCDQAPGVEPPGGDPPRLTQFEFDPQQVTLGEPGVEEEGGRVRFSVTMRVTAEDSDGDIARVSYVVRSPYSDQEPVAEGDLTSSGGSQYEQTATVRVDRGAVGVYTVLVYAVDEAGSLSDNVRGMLAFSAEGGPPEILEVDAPETVQRPAAGEDPTVFRLTATVTDPDGLENISEVVFWNLNTPATTIEMADDGENGDVLPNDGIYTRLVQVESGNQPGETVLAFQATDRTGLTSNVVEKTIVVE